VSVISRRHCRWHSYNCTVSKKKKLHPFMPGFQIFYLDWRIDTLKVIPFNCIAHPFYASFFAWLVRAGARARSELDRFSVKAEQFREITGRFLLNELGDPHFLMHKFKWHTVEYNIPWFQEKLKFCFEIFLFKRRKEHVFRYSRVCTHTANSSIFFISLIPVQLK